MLPRSRYPINAGLFAAIDEADVNFELVNEVVEELYYPKSPYAFAVVDPTVLAAIYEQFLSERVEIAEDRSVSLKLKPELVHRGGIVATPGYIVDELLERTLDQELATRDAADVQELTAADISCGSGIVLLEIFRRLLARREVDEPDTDRLILKHEILANNVFGVDVDAEAVEVAKFNLLLAVLEGEDDESMLQFGKQALPNLD